MADRAIRFDTLGGREIMTSEVMVAGDGGVLMFLAVTHHPPPTTQHPVPSVRSHPAPGIAPVGVLLREWRAARRVSQLHLALEAGTSSRHLSYLETGKAQPSRGMIGRLAEALD